MTQHRAPKDIDLGDGYLLVGKFVTDFSELDFQFSTFVTAFFRMGEKHAWVDSLVHTIDVSRKCEILKAFCTDLEGFQDVKKTVEKIEKLASVRNIVAHGRLARNTDGQLYLRLQGATRFFKTRGQTGKLLVNDILDQCEVIELCHRRLDEHTRDLQAMFAAMPERGE